MRFARRPRSLLVALAFLSGLTGDISGAGQSPVPDAIIRDQDRRAPTGTGSISGIVVAAASGLALRNAEVSASGGHLTAQATTDAQGRFVLDHLPVGSFELTVVREHYLPFTYGQTRPGRPGTPIDLAEGQRVRATLAMTLGSVITGTIVDDTGEAVIEARVRALQFVLVNGFRRLRSVKETSSDDRGAYRLYGLEPGEYLISATLPMRMSSFNRILSPIQNATTVVLADGNGPPLRFDNVNGAPFSPTFYPGVATPESAQRVSVEAGAERSNVDISVLPTHMGSIEGVVSGFVAAETRVQILLQNTEPQAERATATTWTDATGRFSLTNITPGTYIVYAQTTPGESQNTFVVPGTGMVVTPDDVRTSRFPRLHGRAVAIVTGESPAVIGIALKPGRSISGRVASDTPVAPESRTLTTISITPIPQNPQLPAFNTSPQVNVDADGRFTLPGIRPGRYILHASGPGLLKSAMLRGEDTLDVGLEVGEDDDVGGVELTLTERRSELSGTITNSSGKPATGNTIVVAPSDSRLWRNGSRRIATTRPSSDGRYAIRGLPAGEYYLAAVTDIEPGEQFDTDFLSRLATAAVRVIIRDAAETQQHLQVSQ